MTKRKTPLPDKWERKFRDGRVLNPPKGHKVGIYWGDLLKLEYYLREVEKNLSATSAQLSHYSNLIDQDADTQGEDFYLCLARDSVRNIEFILATLRRTGKPPSANHPDWPPQHVVYAGRQGDRGGEAEQASADRNFDDEIPL